MKRKIQRGTNHRNSDTAGGGQKVVELAREHAVSEATVYNWKSKYGGIE